MTRRTDPRTARLPIPAGELPAFTPVPRQCHRHDGWTPERQHAFIEALADTGSVEAACKAVNMAQRGAYYLRRQPGAEQFRTAWQAALQLGVARVEDVAMDRALNGVEEPVYSYGALIGTRRRYNDRLLMFILRNRAPERFATGGGAKALNAVGQMEIKRLKKQWRKQWREEWRKEWEAEQHNVSPAEIRASIDRKIEDIRRRFQRESEHRWAALSAETRNAWAHFLSLRDRDLAVMQADAKTREVLDVGWEANSTHFDSPERKRLAGPEGREGPDAPAPVRQWQPPEPPVEREQQTTWTLRDESFEP